MAKWPRHPLFLLQTHLQIDGVCHDLGYDIETIQHMSQVKHFPSINAKLVRAAELKTQLDNMESKQRQENPEDESRRTTTTVAIDHSNYDQPPTTSVNHGDFKPKSFD